MRADRLEVFRKPVGSQLRRVADERRPASAPLVIEDERQLVRQRLQVREEVVHVEPGPAMDDHQRVSTVPDDPEEDLHVLAGIDVAFPHLQPGRSLRGSVGIPIGAADR